MLALGDQASWPVVGGSSAVWPVLPILPYFNHSLVWVDWDMCMQVVHGKGRVDLLCSCDQRR